MTAPRISVVMPVWNGEKYLREAVDSLLAQTFTDFELLALDDGSTDSTPEILASYRDPRVRHIRLEHVGLIAAERIGVAQARAEWIARQDADDSSHPARLQRQWDAVARRPNAVFCYTGVRRVGEVPPNAKPGHFPRSRALLALKLCWQSPFTHSSVMYRKADFLAAGQYDERDYPSDDYALWGRLFERGEFIGVGQALVTYRVLSSSVSRVNAPSVNEHTRRIGIKHCQQFMRLSETEAGRAFDVLALPPEKRPWGEWQWFLRHCVPRLRWKSVELYAWLASQSVRSLNALARSR